MSSSPKFRRARGIPKKKRACRDLIISRYTNKIRWKAHAGSSDHFRQLFILSWHRILIHFATVIELKSANWSLASSFVSRLAVQARVKPLDSTTCIQASVLPCVYKPRKMRILVNERQSQEEPSDDIEKCEAIRRIKHIDLFAREFSIFMCDSILPVPNSPKHVWDSGTHAFEKSKQKKISGTSYRVNLFAQCGLIFDSSLAADSFER